MRSMGGNDRAEGLSPIVVNDRDSGIIFALQADSPFPAWSQPTAVLNNKWDEVLVGRVFCARRSKFWSESNCPFEYFNPSPLPWLRIPIIHTSCPTKDNLLQAVNYLIRTGCTTV